MKTSLLVELDILVMFVSRTEGTRTMVVVESRRAFLKGTQVTLKFDVTMLQNRGDINR
jgi:hypothetical protein